MPNSSVQVQKTIAKEKLSAFTGWAKLEKPRNALVLEANSDYGIVKDLDSNEKILVTRDKELSLEEAKIVFSVAETARDSFASLQDDEIAELVRSYCFDNHTTLTLEHLGFLAERVKWETKGLSVLERFLALRDVEEIAVVNEKTPVFVFHARHGWLKTDTVLRSQNKIIELANRIARSTSRRVTLKSPTLNASLA